MTSPYDSSVAVVTTGGSAKVPTNWGEEPFACRITGPNNNWINLDDHENYITAADSFGSSATQQRRSQVTGPYVAGKFTTYAVPDQVTENVTIYVLGDSQTVLQANLANLIDAVNQLYFQLVWSVGETSYTWDCDCADYTIDFVNTSMFARQLSVKLSIPRNPVITMGSIY